MAVLTMIGILTTIAIIENVIWEIVKLFDNNVEGLIAINTIIIAILLASILFK